MAFVPSLHLCAGAHAAALGAVNEPETAASAASRPGIHVTLQMNAVATPGGAPLLMPQHPRVDVARVTLMPGHALPRSPDLVQRYARIDEGVLYAPDRGRTLRAGQWLVDDGQQEWRAAPQVAGRPTRLLVIDHVRLRDTGSPGAPPALEEAPWPMPRHAPGMVSLSVSRDRRDYQGLPITMPTGPLRVQTSRYEINGGWQLPWHRHAWQRYGLVESGSIVVEDEYGRTRTFGEGEFIVELRNTWHRGSNLGRTPAVLQVIDVMPADQAGNSEQRDPLSRPVPVPVATPWRASEPRTE